MPCLLPCPFPSHSNPRHTWSFCPKVQPEQLDEVPHLCVTWFPAFRPAVSLPCTSPALPVPFSQVPISGSVTQPPAAGTESRCSAPARTLFSTLGRAQLCWTLTRHPQALGASLGGQQALGHEDVLLPPRHGGLRSRTWELGSWGRTHTCPLQGAGLGQKGLSISTPPVTTLKGSLALERSAGPAGASLGPTSPPDFPHPAALLSLRSPWHTDSTLEMASQEAQPGIPRCTLCNPRDVVKLPAMITGGARRGP